MDLYVMHMKIAPMLLFRGVQRHSATKEVKTWVGIFLSYRWLLLVFDDVV